MSFPMDIEIEARPKVRLQELVTKYRTDDWQIGQPAEWWGPTRKVDEDTSRFLQRWQEQRRRRQVTRFLAIPMRIDAPDVFLQPSL